MAAHLTDDSHQKPLLSLVVDRTADIGRRLDNRARFRLGFVLGLALASELGLAALVLIGTAPPLVGALVMASITICSYTLVVAELMAQSRFGLGPVHGRPDDRVKAVFTDPAVKTNL